jgi:hypothetical protein
MTAKYIADRQKWPSEIAAISRNIKNAMIRQAPAEGSLRYPAPIHESRLRLGYLRKARRCICNGRRSEVATLFNDKPPKAFA